MANMSYCRFRNTDGNLRDCFGHMDDDVDQDEAEARLRIITVAVEIAEIYGEEIGAKCDVRSLRASESGQIAGRQDEPTRRMTFLEHLDRAAEDGLEGAPYGVEELAQAAAGEIRHMREQVERVIAGEMTAAEIKADWLAREDAWASTLRC